MRWISICMICLICQVFCFGQMQVRVPYPSTKKGTLHGRLFLLLSADSTTEPRMQIVDGIMTAQVYGVDVDDWTPGSSRSINANAFGYPKERLSQLAAGKYYVQVLFHEYEVFRRKDGHVVKLPMDRGEGQHWNLAPGNVYSTPRWERIDPGISRIITITADRTIPPIQAPADTRYIKHIRMQSKLLSEFWGRPMYLGAHVLLPEGWEEHPNVKYPLAIFHGHYPEDFDGFRTVPPDTSLKPDYSVRFNLHGYNRIVQQEAYDFYKMWTGQGFPRVLAVEIQHPTPYYDDSYAVNSENNGPYGDAIVKELIPEIERRFRGIGEGWARFVYGGSTGGWEALAVQIFYPDEFNGCFAACPDPVDFRAYVTVDLYKDTNAYYANGAFLGIERAGSRDVLGQVTATLRQMNMRELALGTKSRSGEQFDIWEAVYGPVGKDGYPKRIWDKYTGRIDTGVVRFMRDNYDLSFILQRDWKQLGPKLKDKMKIYCGDMDNFFLNNAVYLIEERLKALTSPTPGAFVDYGDRAGHCWNGDHSQPIWISRLRYHRLFIPQWAEEVRRRAPAGADLESWRY